MDLKRRRGGRRRRRLFAVDCFLGCIKVNRDRDGNCGARTYLPYPPAMRLASKLSSDVTRKSSMRSRSSASKFCAGKKRVSIEAGGEMIGMHDARTTRPFLSDRNSLLLLPLEGAS